MQRTQIIVTFSGAFRAYPPNIIALSGAYLGLLVPRLSHEMLHLIIERVESEETSRALDNLLNSKGDTSSLIGKFYPLFYRWSKRVEWNRKHGTFPNLIRRK